MNTVESTIIFYVRRDDGIEAVTCMYVLYVHVYIHTYILYICMYSCMYVSMCRIYHTGYTYWEETIETIKFRVSL